MHKCVCPFSVTLARCVRECVCVGGADVGGSVKVRSISDSVLTIAHWKQSKLPRLRLSLSDSTALSVGLSTHNTLFTTINNNKKRLIQNQRAFWFFFIEGHPAAYLNTETIPVV